jgi:GTP cyclohydrolase I
MIEKNDPILGKRVYDYLVSLQIETPLNLIALGKSNEDKVTFLIPLIQESLVVLGLDITDDSLADTAKRVAKMWVYEDMMGLDYNNFPKCTTIQNKINYGTHFVCEKNIQIQSLCEHHLKAISGYATIAYIPRQKVLGLSKLNRIANFYSRRPQVQERLTMQIAAAISFVAETPDVAVYIDAVHDCVKTRGIMDPCSDTVTLQTLGVFSVGGGFERAEFLQVASLQKQPV